MSSPESTGQHREDSKEVDQTAARENIASLMEAGVRQHLGLAVHDNRTAEQDAKINRMRVAIDRALKNIDLSWFDHLAQDTYQAAMQDHIPDTVPEQLQLLASIKALRS